ncbi:hypothetical protein JT359_16745 [Candidatus Poribacteria bacterium]|nr:hypothetical protein [Candidatus Poribacteria bacterium]
MMNYQELPFPQHILDEIRQILSDRSEMDTELGIESILRSLQELATEDLETQSCFADIVIRLLDTSLNSPNPEAALNRLSRFLVVAFNRRWIYQLLRDAPFLIEPVIICFGSSTYLSELLIRYPTYFYDIIDANVMNIQKSRECMFEEIGSLLSRYRDMDQQLTIIRRYKRRESLRIALRDILQADSVETTTLEMSNLAEATLQHCYEIGSEQVIKPKFGIPQNEDGTEPCRFAVIGMGKFGGYELNFSSDIDLIFVYSDEGKTDKGVDNGEYYSRLCEFLIKAMSEVTSEGYVFRVDIRLRPESSAGVIIRSMESYESYYEGWGDLWERQALIKARPVAGDIDFGNEFIRMIHPFVYQRYLDGVSLTEIKADIRNTKVRIEERLINEKTDTDRHVKLGPGTIRDIEFTVQCLQMIHGGKRKSLCSQNTLFALTELQTSQLIDEEDAQVLIDAYRFFRRVENAIQIESDQQRYLIPSKKEEVTQFAITLGYKIDPLDEFQSDYNTHRSGVRSVFEKVMDIHEPDALDLAVLLSQDDTNEIQEQLSKFGFENTRDAHRLLGQLANGGEGQQFSPSVRRTFFQFAPILLQHLSQAPDPDMSLRYFEAFAAKVGARSSYYNLFMDMPDVLGALTCVCGTSLYLADLLITHPELFDLLTIPSFIESAKTLPEKLEEVQQLIEQTPSAQTMQAIRRYKNDEIWRIALRHILGNADLPTTTSELSDLAEAILQTLYTIIDDRIRKEHGDPISDDGTDTSFAIIGMGKLGGRELNFSSDLDVMLVYSADGKTTKGMPNSEYYSLLGLELGKQLGGDHGMSIYELDLRLRPYGTGGAIALPLSGYENYYSQAGEIWERQALTRARVVAGDRENLGEDFMDIAHVFCYQESLSAEGVAEIVHTRQRKEVQATRTTKTRRSRRGKTQRPTTNVKSGYGGLVDIEFAVQTLQLIHGKENNSIRVANTLLAIEKLNEIEVLSDSQSTDLTEAYKFLRRVENALRIVHDRALDALPSNRAELTQLARRLAYTDTENLPIVEAFLQDYGKWTEKTRSLFNEILVSNRQHYTL